jgi:hypothetical protein
MNGPDIADEFSQDHRAIILCAHVASRELPILLAVRDDPVEEADSGWQCLCDSGRHEDPAEAKVWAVDEVLKLEPSLASYIDLQPGTRVVRSSAHAPWQLVSCGR